MAEPAKPTRRGVRWLIVVAVNLTLLVLGGELVARAVLPSGLFSVASNIYRAVENPEVGYTLKPGYHGVAFGVPLDTNSLGFRGPEWSLTKRPGTLRIALVGDSMAFGYGVPYEDTLGPSLAHRLGPNSETLVFAAPGYDSLQERAIVGEYVWRYSPDLVIVYAFTNDAEPRMLVDPEGYLFEKGARLDDHFAERLLPTPGLLARHSRLYVALALLWKQHHLLRDLDKAITIPPYWFGPLLKGPPAPPEMIRAVKEPIVDILRDAKQRHVPVLLLLLGASYDYRRLLTDVAREEDVPLLELLSLLDVQSWSELRARYSLSWDAHPNAEANRRFTEGVARLLRERRLVP